MCLSVGSDQSRFLSGEDERTNTMSGGGGGRKEEVASLVEPPPLNETNVVGKESFGKPFLFGRSIL